MENTGGRAYGSRAVVHVQELQQAGAPTVRRSDDQNGQSESETLVPRHSAGTATQGQTPEGHGARTAAEAAVGAPARWQGGALDFESVKLRPATREGCAGLVNTLLHNTERMDGECLGAMPEAEMHMIAPRCRAVPTPVGFPLGGAREPDPLCGRRVSIRPQPTRAPRSEVMALGPSWREATVVCARVESTRSEPGSGDGTVVVTPTARH